MRHEQLQGHFILAIEDSASLHAKSDVQLSFIYPKFPRYIAAAPFLTTIKIKIDI